MNIQLLNYFVNTYKDILRREGRGRKEKNANRMKVQEAGQIQAPAGKTQRDAKRMSSLKGRALLQGISQGL